jgi:hypothetical protein
MIFAASCTGAEDSTVRGLGVITSRILRSWCVKLDPLLRFVFAARYPRVQNENVATDP